MDETYFGQKKDVPHNRGGGHVHKFGVLALVDRDTGTMRTFTFDRFRAEHGTTLHGAKQYVDLKDRTIHTNTVEGAFSIFKRGMKGVYQHCGEQHLHRYLAEFEFRYNNRIANGVDDPALAQRDCRHHRQAAHL